MFGGISNFEWKMVKNPGQHHQLLFTGAEWHSKFANSLCEIYCSKPLRAFIKLVEGSEIYNFGIYT
jgi:hypothetical protein